VAFCPRQAIKISDCNNAAGYYPAIFNEEAGCTGCAQCAVMCPEVVIEVFRE
jgi:2-oxoglutarate ferredoxin oxidoreductase subunit delta